MDDVNWCRKTHERVGDLSRGFTMLLNQFQLELLDIRQIWSDRAARDFEDQYLEPHRVEGRAFQEQIRQQLQQLADVIERMTDVTHCETNLNRLSEMNLEHRTKSDSKAQSAHRSIDAALNSSAASGAQASEARALLASI